MWKFLVVAALTLVVGCLTVDASRDAAAGQELRQAGSATSVFVGKGPGYRVRFKRRAGKLFDFRMTAQDRCDGQRTIERVFSFNRKLAIAPDGRFSGSAPAYGEDSLKGRFRGRFAFGAYTNWVHADEHFGFPACEIKAGKQTSTVRFRARRID